MKRSLQFYKNAYRRILRLYPSPFRERFAEPMLQTFSDLLRERTEAGRGVFVFALGLFIETFGGILRENVSDMKIQKESIVRIAVGTGLVLLLPLVAMQFTNEVAWGAGDFIVAGVLLFGAGLGYNVVARKFSIVAYRRAVALTIATALLLVWVNLAVGIIGNEANLANLMFGGVLAIGLVGGLLARFQPRGMTWALVAMAVAQLSVSAITHVLGWGATFAVNGFFAALWIVSALLFHSASRGDSESFNDHATDHVGDGGGIL